MVVHEKKKKMEICVHNDLSPVIRIIVVDKHSRFSSLNLLPTLLKIRSFIRE